MKIKLSKNQWEEIGNKAGWMRKANKELRSFMVIEQGLNGSGHNHHLRLKCGICGKIQTCKCSELKTEIVGICSYCEDKRKTQNLITTLGD